jgi:hypothetical protein
MLIISKYIVFISLLLTFAQGQCPADFELEGISMGN